MPFTSKPKPPGQAVTRHKRLDFVEVPDKPRKARPLPKRRGYNGGRWPAGIADKWRAWSTMPHTVLWKPTDWEFAVDSLHVAATVIETGDVACVRELRIRERVMGTTVDARLMLRIRYTPAEAPQEKASVSRLDDYRAL